MKTQASSRKALSSDAASALPTSVAAAIPAALRNFDVLPDAAHVRLPVVCALYQVSCATVWRWSKNGRIPAPRRLSEGVTAWPVGELRKALRGEAWQ